MEEKSFSENAKGFFNAWKNDFAEKNKDILNRKKIREAEYAKLDKEMNDLFNEIKDEFMKSGKEIFSLFEQKLNEVTKAIKDSRLTKELHQEMDDKYNELISYLEQNNNTETHKMSELAISAKSKVDELVTIDDVLKQAENLDK